MKWGVCSSIAVACRPALLLEQQCWVLLSQLLLVHESPEGEQRVPPAVLNGNPVMKKPRREQSCGRPN